MAYTAEILTSSIVVVGEFNPAIFTPDWLLRNNLIGEGDAAAARDENQGGQFIASYQVAAFETDWFALQVLKNQLSLTSKGVFSPALRDLAVGVFQLLSHTPVRAVGLNFLGHFKLDTQELRHKIGDVFAPKEIWDTLYPDEFSGLEQLTIRIQQGTRDDPVSTRDEKRITLLRSTKVKYGISLAINDHHDVTVDEENDLTGAERLAIIVDEQWEDDWKDAVKVFDKVLSDALEI